MSNVQALVSRSISMDLDFDQSYISPLSPSLISGMPLMTIPEEDMPSDEDEDHLHALHSSLDAFQEACNRDERVRAMCTDEILITTECTTPPLFSSSLSSSTSKSSTMDSHGSNTISSRRSSSSSNSNSSQRALALSSNQLSINLSFLSPSTPPLCSSSLSSPFFSSPPSASYSSCSSALSSPGGSTTGSAAFSPILNPFQWTSDLRQYIMTDIGPQPSNSQVPVLRSPHLQLVRQRSYSKIGGPGFMAPSIMSPSMSSPSLSTADEKTALGMSFPPSGPLTGVFGTGGMPDMASLPQDKFSSMHHQAWEGIID